MIQLYRMASPTMAERTDRQTKLDEKTLRRPKRAQRGVQTRGSSSLSVGLFLADREREAKTNGKSKAVVQ